MATYVPGSKPRITEYGNRVARLSNQNSGKTSKRLVSTVTITRPDKTQVIRRLYEEKTGGLTRKYYVDQTLEQRRIQTVKTGESKRTTDIKAGEGVYAKLTTEGTVEPETYVQRNGRFERTGLSYDEANKQVEASISNRYMAELDFVGANEIDYKTKYNPPKNNGLWSKISTGYESLENKTSNLLKGVDSSKIKIGGAIIGVPSILFQKKPLTTRISEDLTGIYNKLPGTTKNKISLFAELKVAGTPFSSKDFGGFSVGFIKGQENELRTKPLTSIAIYGGGVVVGKTLQLGKTGLTSATIKLFGKGATASRLLKVGSISGKATGGLLAGLWGTSTLIETIKAPTSTGKGTALGKETYRSLLFVAGANIGSKLWVKNPDIINVKNLGKDLTTTKNYKGTSVSRGKNVQLVRAYSRGKLTDYYLSSETTTIIKPDIGSNKLLESFTEVNIKEFSYGKKTSIKEYNGFIKSIGTSKKTSFGGIPVTKNVNSFTVNTYKNNKIYGGTGIAESISLKTGEQLLTTTNTKVTSFNKIRSPDLRIRFGNNKRLKPFTTDVSITTKTAQYSNNNLLTDNLISIERKNPITTIITTTKNKGVTTSELINNVFKKTTGKISDLTTITKLRINEGISYLKTKLGSPRIRTTNPYYWERTINVKNLINRLSSEKQVLLTVKKSSRISSINKVSGSLGLANPRASIVKTSTDSAYLKNPLLLSNKPQEKLKTNIGTLSRVSNNIKSVVANVNNNSLRIISDNISKSLTRTVSITNNSLTNLSKSISVSRTKALTKTKIVNVTAVNTISSIRAVTRQRTITQTIFSIPSIPPPSIVTNPFPAIMPDIGGGGGGFYGFRYPSKKLVTIGNRPVSDLISLTLTEATTFRKGTTPGRGKYPREERAITSGLSWVYSTVEERAYRKKGYRLAIF